MSSCKYANRSVSVLYQPDGSMVLQARLPAEQGALLKKALELAAERRRNAGRNDGMTTDEKVSAETRIREPFHVSHADALTDLAETYLNSDTGSGGSADRYQVVVHVSAETLKSGDTGES